MFNNWINIEEPYRIVRKLYRDPDFVLKIITRLSKGRIGRIKAAWTNTENPPVHWWDIPAVIKRWNKCISGDPEVECYDYVSRKYWSEKKSLRALVLGCGEGSKVLRWAETKKFSSIEAYDLSDNRIRYAIDAAQKKGYGDIIHYRIGDVAKLQVPENSYDVIICEGSLHHFSSLATLLPRINASLTFDGEFIVNEFVGPTRFQWTDRQLEIVNGLLSIFPDRYTMDWNRHTPKLAVIRPSKLGMVLYDPSEAVESSKILPLLHSNFTVVEQKGYGGTILHLLFDGIAHHFLTPDTIAERLLKMSFVIEDLMLESGDIQHDFVFAVCKKREAA